MHQITPRSETPAGLTALQKTYPHPKSGDWKKQENKAKHQHYYKEVRETLIYDQDSLCIYCERLIDTKENHGHIDHFIPRDANASLTFDWDNLMASCDFDDSCGNKKGSSRVANWLNPYHDMVQDYLRFVSTTGEVEPNPEHTVRQLQHTQQTIDGLGLNHFSLSSKRKQILAELNRSIQALSEDPDALQFFVETALTQDKPFPTARHQMIERLLPAE